MNLVAIKKKIIPLCVMGLMAFPATSQAGLLSSCRELIDQGVSVVKKTISQTISLGVKKTRDRINNSFPNAPRRFPKGTDQVSRVAEGQVDFESTTQVDLRPLEPVSHFQSQLAKSALQYRATISAGDRTGAALLKTALDLEIEKGIRADRFDFFDAKDPDVKDLTERNYKTTYAWAFVEPALQAAGHAYGDGAERFFNSGIRNFFTPTQIATVFALANKYKVVSFGNTIRAYFYYNKRAEVRKHALEAIIRLYGRSKNPYHHERLVRIVNDALAEKNTEFETIVTENLSILAGVIPTDLLRKIVSLGILHENPAIRVAAYRYMVHYPFHKMPESTRASILLQIVNDDHPDVREIAIPLLANDLTPQAVDHFKKLILDENSVVRTMAYAFLVEKHFSHPIVSDLWRAYFVAASDRDLDSVIAAIVAKGDQNPKFTLKVLGDLKARVKDVLQHSNTEPAFPLVEGVLKSNKIKNENDPITKIINEMRYQNEKAWAQATNHLNEPRMIRAVFQNGTSQQIFLFTRQLVKNTGPKELNLARKFLRERIGEDPSFAKEVAGTIRLLN